MKICHQQFLTKPYVQAVLRILQSQFMNTHLWNFTNNSKVYFHPHLFSFWIYIEGLFATSTQILMDKVLNLESNWINVEFVSYKKFWINWIIIETNGVSQIKSRFWMIFYGFLFVSAFLVAPF